MPLVFLTKLTGYKIGLRRTMEKLHPDIAMVLWCNLNNRPVNQDMLEVSIADRVI